MFVLSVKNVFPIARFFVDTLELTVICFFAHQYMVLLTEAFLKLLHYSLWFAAVILYKFW